MQAEVKNLLDKVTGHIPVKSTPPVSCVKKYPFWKKKI